MDYLFICFSVFGTFKLYCHHFVLDKEADITAEENRSPDVIQ